MTDTLPYTEALELSSPYQLEVRLANDELEIRAAQALRYRVFCREMGARLSSEAHQLGLESDPFDVYCDHLLVIDQNRPVAQAVVGTYRLMTGDKAFAERGFYSAGEYNLKPILGRVSAPGRLLEVGRSCVAPEYRSIGTLQLLWRGIARYMSVHRTEALFGCASFPTTDVAAIAEQLNYLTRHYLAPVEYRVHPQPGRGITLPNTGNGEINYRRVRRFLPPLIKAYIRIGAVIGDGAVVDAEFGTTDIFVYLDVERIPNRYNHRFGY